MGAESILGWVGKGNIDAPTGRRPAYFPGAPGKIQIVGVYINDYLHKYTVPNPISHVPLPKREAPLVGNLGGRLLLLPTLFRRLCAKFIPLN